jgi:tRNA(Ile)-lysidine synthase
VLGGAALSRELCEEDDVALEAWLESLKIVATETMLDLSPLIGKPRALWRRALRRWPPIGAMSRAGFDDLLALCAAGGEGRMSLSEGFASVKNAVVSWERSSSVTPWSPLILREGLTVLLPDGAELVMRRIKLDPPLKQRVMSGGVDREQEAYVADVRLPLSARPWRHGDRFRPLGAPGSAKLQDLFVNRKISMERRGLLPVVCGADDEILWVPGFPPAEHAKVTDQTSSGVQLTYRRGTFTLTIQS